MNPGPSPHFGTTAFNGILLQWWQHQPSPAPMQTPSVHLYQSLVRAGSHFSQIFQFFKTLTPPAFHNCIALFLLDIPYSLILLGVSLLNCTPLDILSNSQGEVSPSLSDHDYHFSCLLKTSVPRIHPRLNGLECAGEGLM